MLLKYNAQKEVYWKQNVFFGTGKKGKRASQAYGSMGQQHGSIGKSACCHTWYL